MSTTKPDYRRFNDCPPTFSITANWGDFHRPESISESVERLHWEKHAQYQKWQDAVTMNMVFGDDYVTTPPIPKGYEKLAKQWHDNLKPVR
jgi:hypothetical protein